ncbi:MAG: hypothetical protein L6R39_003689 [Caloplaca ligustica]|nr:MAG: hypothetical protein L6R39_003689 [Caloplaca ligustica]
MGICSSCLGGGRRKKHEDPETSRLLSDNPYTPNYGSRAHNTRRSAEEADIDNAKQRERAALESIAHGMSEVVVDIFTILPESSDDVNQDRSGSPPPQTNGFKEDDARAQPMAYRTVKKAHLDKITAPLSSMHDWKDVLG